jgi:hypothetical protein
MAGRWFGLGLVLALGCGSSTPSGSSGKFCSSDDYTNLPMSLTFSKQPCSYTAAQVAAGIVFTYQEVIEEAWSLRPIPQDLGGCQTPDDAGLIVGYKITGGGQSYCRCDVGLCAAQSFATTSVIGTHDRTVSWDGRNWNGPSDTNTAEGSSFPPGSYAVTLTATGTYSATTDGGAIDSGVSPTFGIGATFPFTITP